MREQKRRAEENSRKVKKKETEKNRTRLHLTVFLSVVSVGAVLVASISVLTTLSVSISSVPFPLAACGQVKQHRRRSKRMVPIRLFNRVPFELLSDRSCLEVL